MFCKDTGWIFSDVKGTSMKRINVWYFYVLGSVVRPLASIGYGLDIESRRQDSMTAVLAYPMLDQIVTESPVPLRICTEEAKHLAAALFRVIRGPKDDPDIVQHLYAIREAAKSFETTLAAELREMDTFCVSSVGIFKTTALLTTPEEMFFDKASALPPETLAEIQEASRCLAFSISTAAAFHIMRAVESVLRRYYDKLSGGAARPARSAMGIYLDEILKLTGVDRELHAALKQIKTLYRDPVAHPEVFLTLPEAVNLLGVAQSAINRMLVLIQTP